MKVFAVMDCSFTHLYWRSLELEDGVKSARKRAQCPKPLELATSGSASGYGADPLLLVGGLRGSVPWRGGQGTQ